MNANLHNIGSFKKAISLLNRLFQQGSIAEFDEELENIKREAVEKKDHMRCKKV